MSPAVRFLSPRNEREVRAQDQDEDSALDAGPCAPQVQAETGVEVPEIRHIANEAYTSGTRSWDGFAAQELGGSKTVPDGTIIVDRDMNGARGIMLRAP